MLNLFGFLIALPFLALALLLFALFSPFALVNWLGAGLGLLAAVLGFVVVAAVFGVVGTVITGVLGLVGTLLGALLGLVLPLVLLVLALAFMAALIPLLLPVALVAGIVWLVARANRANHRPPSRLPHAVA